MTLSEYLLYVFIVCICYILGAIPTSYLLGKYLVKTNIMKVGSQNAGASNLFENGGKLLGLLAGLIDCFIKGTAPILLIESVIYIQYYDLIFASMALIIGHNWSVFLRFKGGRGISTAIGLLIGFQMWEVILVLAVFVGIIGRFVFYKDSGFWCFIAFMLLPILCLLFHWQLHLVIFTLVLGILLIFKRLTSNSIPPLNSSFKSILLCRLVFDRDIMSRSVWLSRSES